MTRIALIALIAGALLVGCNSDGTDRAGGEKPVEAKVLVMANANYDVGELEAFDRAVRRVSDGRLRIKWVNEYAKGRSGNVEANLIRDVSAGKVDLGWAGSRVFDQLGDVSFNPLHAPLLVDSYELEEAVVSDDLVKPMLDSLGELGLQGIGVLPGPLRRPLGRHALLGPDDWAGDRIAYSGGGQIENSLRSLGARAAYDNPSVTEPADELDGIETHLAAVPGNHYQHDFPSLTGNVVLWPRPLVLFAGPKVSQEDLEVLQEAARAAIPDTVALLRAREREPLAEICRTGVKVGVASESEIEALHTAVQPVYDQLEGDEDTSETLARIQALAEADASAPGSVRCPAAAEPATEATIPAGTYRTRVSREVVEEHGFTWAQVVESDPDPRALKAKVKEWRLEFTDDGTFIVYDVQLDGTPSIGWEGSYSTYRDVITVNGNEGTTITARVEVNGDRLRFTDVQPGPKTPEALTWGSAPYVKIR